MKHSEKIDQIVPVFLKAQSEMPDVVKDAVNPQFNSKYATKDAILKVVKGHLQKYGLGIIQNGIPCSDEQGNLTGILVETTVIHISGQYLSAMSPMPLAKGTPQGAGSTMTYGCRYSIAALFALNIDEDDDGNSASEAVKQPSRPAIGIAEVKAAVASMKDITPTTTKNRVPSCPQCGGQMWDNRSDSDKRASEGKPRTPYFKCKKAPKKRGDEGCSGVIWKDDWDASNAVVPPKQDMRLVPDADMEFPAALKDAEDDGLPF